MGVRSGFGPDEVCFTPLWDAFLQTSLALGWARLHQGTSPHGIPPARVFEARSSVSRTFISDFPGMAHQAHSWALEARTAHPPKLAASACQVLVAFFPAPSVSEMASELKNQTPLDSNSHSGQASQPLELDSVL